MTSKRAYLGAGWGVLGVTTVVLSYALIQGRSHPGLSNAWMWPFVVGAVVLFIGLVAYHLWPKGKQPHA